MIISGRKSRESDKSYGNHSSKMLGNQRISSCQHFLNCDFRMIPVIGMIISMNNHGLRLVQAPLGAAYL